MATPTPFRFLSLPAELRKMVYELLEDESRPWHINLPQEAGGARNYDDEDAIDTYWLHPVRITIVTKSVSLAILFTCQFIYQDALPIMKNRIRTVSQIPPRIIVNSPGLFDSAGQQSVFAFLISEIGAVQGAAEYNTSRTPALLPSHFRQRLQAYHWGSYLSAGDVAALSSFILHAAFYTRTVQPTNRGVQVMVHPKKNGTHWKLDELRSAVDEFYSIVLHECLQHRVALQIKLHLPRSRFTNQQRRLSLHNTFYSAITESLRYRSPADELRWFKYDPSVAIYEEEF